MNEFNKPQAGDATKDVQRILCELGIPESLVGYDYICEAIRMVHSDRSYARRITSRLYPAVAESCDTFSNRVERGIRYAIERAWQHGDRAAQATYFGGIVSPEKGKPTNGEFIARLAALTKEVRS